MLTRLEVRLFAHLQPPVPLLALPQGGAAGGPAGRGKEASQQQPAHWHALGPLPAAAARVDSRAAGQSRWCCGEHAGRSCKYKMLAPDLQRGGDRPSKVALRGLRYEQYSPLSPGDRDFPGPGKASQSKFQVKMQQRELPAKPPVARASSWRAQLLAVSTFPSC